MEEIKDLTRHIIELYINKENSAKLSSFFCNQITWLDSEKNKFFKNKSEIIEAMEKSKNIPVKNINVFWEESKITQVSDFTSYSVSLVKVDYDYLNTHIKDKCYMMTMLWSKENGIWKVMHIHSSKIDSIDESKTYHEINIYEEMISESIHKAKSTDSLTNINNVQGFEDDVKELLRLYPENQYAMIKFGIRNFRFVNRRYGYQVGDQVLKNIAKNLLKSLKDDETCGRIEKDHFAMLYHYKDEKNLDKRMDQVRKKLIDKSILKKLNIEVNLAAGIYIVERDKDIYIKDMLDKALIAQQSVSRFQMGSHFAYFENNLIDEQYHNSKVLNAAPKALDNNEFKLYIQPQFDIYTKKIVAGEALCRWIDYEGVLHMPDTFIPVFEEHGFILNFDFYMLDQLCKTLRRWMDEGTVIFPISINQSRLHIEEENYFKDFCSVVDHYRIPHHYLAFELTETVFVENSDKVISLANELHKEGFQLAIDDFGTGYASMNLLSVISADILKLDKGLLMNLDNNSRSKIIMKKVVEMAHNMDMVVVSEGVETEAQLDFLKEIQCDIGQGYLIGKPIEANEFIKLCQK